MSEQIEKYDKRGNKIYYRHSDGCEYWFKYDKIGNQIYQKDSTGYEWWKKFDEHNNVIYSKNTNGDESWPLRKYNRKYDYYLHHKNSEA